MRNLIVLGVAALVAGALLVVPAATAGGSGAEVIKRGTCTGSSTWKLKAKHDDGRIETEFEVDQNRVGKRWRVALRHDGAVVFRRVRTTRAPSGSFEVRRFLNNADGPRIVARARALATGEICRGALTI